MASHVKDLTVELDSFDESHRFSNKDDITGKVTLHVTKKTRVASLQIKAKGKASVMWSENYGRYSVVYYDKETCYKSTQYFIEEQKGKDQHGYSLLTNENGNSYSIIVQPGIHVYPFTFQLPDHDMPATFKCSYGKVVYFLEAKLCRPLCLSKKAKIKFNYVPLGNMSDLMISQHGHKEKKMNFLVSGSVTMDVSTNKMGYHMGEQMEVVVDIVNKSNRAVKPRFCFYQKQSFFASNRRKVSTKRLLKEKGDAIQPSTNERLTKVLTIPTDISVSILNCKVLKVEYRLKVSLDARFSNEPTVKLPVVILQGHVTPEDKDFAKKDMAFGFDTDQETQLVEDLHSWKLK